MGRIAKDPGGPGDALTLVEGGQAGPGSTQVGVENDRAAGDRDLLLGGELGAPEFPSDVRDRSAQQRRETAQRRLEEAAARDAIARARDQLALKHDQLAAERDRELDARDVARARDVRAVTGAEVIRRAAEDRRGAALDRASAAEGRARALADREEAARDREQAARDREQAQADRDALLHQLAIAETDALTGARTRTAGLADLDDEIDRAHRTTGQLVIAYVDIVGLEAVYDGHGHAAGDGLLQRAARAIRGHLRSYDLIVRYGTDEFLCVMPGATVDGARQRFAAVQTALRLDPYRCEVKAGFAALAEEEDATELIRRADAERPTKAGPSDAQPPLPSRSPAAEDAPQAHPPGGSGRAVVAAPSALLLEKLGRALQDLIESASRRLEVPARGIETHVWQPAPDATALEQLLQARAGDTPPTGPQHWRRGEGVVGGCWETGEDVYLDLQLSELQDVHEATFRQLPDAVRMGLSYLEFQRARLDFRAIWAVPIYRHEHILGVLSLSLDSDHHEPLASELPRKVHELLRSTARLIEFALP